jgi:PiT family inorganic phosphate transporter
MDLAQVSMTLVLLVLLALAFDFMNGFHDAANSIATVVSTGVLKPWQAVLWAAFFNVLAWAVFHLSVAATVGKGIIDPQFVDSRVIFGALIGAISWNLITWYYGIPSSSSHALIGGMIGAALAKSGIAPLLWPGILQTSSFIFVSPMLGMLLGALIMLTLSWLCFRQTPRRVDRWFRSLQLVSSAAYSIGHGGNDAQKTMGIIWLLLIANGITSADRLPTWVVISCFLAIGLGTMFGGWRIVKTMGQRITKLKPVGGFAAETAGSIALFTATYFGIPVSTTHTITGAIIGVGTTRGSSAVRWGVAGSIVIAWIVTIPASAGIAALAWWIGGVFL